jgi:cell division protease FtsH
MVTQYGMTERLGAIRYGQEQGEVFMGRDFGHTRDYSEDVAAAIDQEVRAFIDAAHHEAFEILVENRDVLDALVVELLEKETLDKADVARIFEPLSRRPVRPAWTGSSRRTPSERGPVQSPKEVADANGSANGSAHGSANGSSHAADGVTVDVPDATA